MMVNQRANYQLTAITLGMILFGGTILGSTPFAFADDDDDGNEELIAKLRDLIQKIKDRIEAEDHDGICKGNHYGDICDNRRPSVGIKEPKRGERIPAGQPFTVVIKAKDKQTGIDMVEVFINGVPFGVAALVSEDLYQLEDDVVLNDPGRYQIKAIATDNAENTSSSRVSIKIV